MTPTHRKKLYHAQCIQWSDDNTAEVIALLAAHAEVSPYGEDLVVRWNDPLSHKYHIDTLHKGVWIRIGENGEMKTMSDAEFKLKYEPTAPIYDGYFIAVDDRGCEVRIPTRNIASGSFTIFGMDLGVLGEFCAQYQLAGGQYPMSQASVAEAFRKTR